MQHRDFYIYQEEYGDLAGQEAEAIEATPSGMIPRAQDQCTTMKRSDPTIKWRKSRPRRFISLFSSVAPLRSLDFLVLNALAAHDSFRVKTNTLIPDVLQIGPIETVRKLARSFSAIDLFMKVIPKNCENNLADYKTALASRVGLDYRYVTDPSNKHPLLQQTEWSDVPDDTEWDVPRLPPGAGPQAISSPLNDREAYRLKRALLRYELFCALFYLGPDKYYDKQHPPLRFTPAPQSCRGNAFCKAQKVFLREYVNPWEIGELAVVSQFMYDLVRYVQVGAGLFPILHKMLEYPKDSCKATRSFISCCFVNSYHNIQLLVAQRAC